MLEDYQNLRRIQLKKNPINDLVLAVYSKSEFFKKNWDDVTKSNRGHVYDTEGNLVANPFDKIFNLNEVEETKEELISTRLENEEYEICEKYNGHLSIVFYHEDILYNNTKGSWNHPFIPYDRQILNKYFSKLDKNLSPFNHANIQEWKEKTFLFEILGDHDKHLMYYDYEKIGLKNSAVLLGVKDKYGLDEPIGNLEYYANFLQCPYTKPLDIKIPEDRTLSDLFKDKGTEGYIIRFANGDRVKVKTDWYLNERYKNQFSDTDFIKKCSY